MQAFPVALGVESQGGCNICHEADRSLDTLCSSVFSTANQKELGTIKTRNREAFLIEGDGETPRPASKIHPDQKRLSVCNTSGCCESLEVDGGKVLERFRTRQTELGAFNHDRYFEHEDTALPGEILHAYGSAMRIHRLLGNRET